MMTGAKGKIIHLGRRIIDFFKAVYAGIVAALKATGNFIIKLIVGIIGLALLIWLLNFLNLIYDFPPGVQLIIMGLASIAEGIGKIALGIISWVASAIWDLISNAF